MSAEILRRAAAAIRDEWGDGPMGGAWHQDRDFHLAVADWLEAEAAAVDFQTQCDHRYRMRDNDEALAVARAYRGESS